MTGREKSILYRRKCTIQYVSSGQEENRGGKRKRLDESKKTGYDRSRLAKAELRRRRHIK